MRTTIVKWGNSQGVRLPKLLLDSVDLADNDLVELKAIDGQIIITKAEAEKKTRKNIRELFAGYDGGSVTEELDWGQPQGDEVW